MSDTKTVKTRSEEPSHENEKPSRLPRKVYNNFGFEFFNAVFWQCVGAPLLLFIRQSGGSAFIIGLTSAFPLLLMPFTLAAVGFVEKLGPRRTSLTFWTLRWVFCVALVPIALLDFSGLPGWQPGLAVAVLVFYHLCRNFALSGYLPWLTALISARIRGLYLSRATFFANLSSVATFLAVGAILGNNPTLPTFAIVFSMGVVGGIVSTIFMSRIEKPRVSPPRPHAQKRLSFWQGLKRYIGYPGFASFIIIQTFYGVAFFGIPSLSLIYLREKVGINPGLILYFSTAGVVGATLASTIWGRWIDRRQSVISLQLIAFAGLCLNSLLWLLLKATEGGLAFFMAAIIMFLSSVWIAALNMSQTHTIMNLAPEDDRVMFQNIATFLTYCSQALAPTLWGLMLDQLDHQHTTIDLGFYRLEAYQIFFAATLIIGLGGVVYLFKTLRANPETLYR